MDSPVELVMESAAGWADWLLLHAHGSLGLHTFVPDGQQVGHAENTWRTR